MSSEINPYDASLTNDSGLVQGDGFWWLRLALKSMAGYYFFCSLTLLFGSDVWIGELPVFALPHIPKSIFFSWVRNAIVDCLVQMGMGYGSASPNMMAAKPWAFAIVFITPTLFLLCVVAISRQIWALRKWVAILVLAAIIDAMVTIWFEANHGFTMY